MKKNLFDFVDNIIDEVTSKIDLDDIFSEPKFKLENNKYVLKLRVPGFERNEIKLDIVDSGLRVKGEHKEGNDIERIDNIYRVPINAAPNTTHAKLRNGILIIEMQCDKGVVKEIKIE